MRTIARRLGKLEDRYHAQLSGGPETALRVIVNIPWETNPEISTCRRTLTTPGSVVEMVELHGQDCQMSEEELDRFVAGFPIETTEGRSCGD
jgi:hypothetical protein